MITLAQIKAARALLNWTQDTLAQAAGLSLPGVNNLERGLTSPRKDTLAAIETALARAGVEFIDTSGVRLKTPDLSVQTIEGADWLGVYDQDIFSVLRSREGELLHLASDNRLWMIYGAATNHHYAEHRERTGFTERILVPETIDYITSPPCAYRTLPAAGFARTDMQIYGDRVAAILWEARKIVLIKSAALADAERARFNLLWAQAKPFTAERIGSLERWDGNKTSRSKNNL